MADVSENVHQSPQRTQKGYAIILPQQQHTVVGERLEFELINEGHVCSARWQVALGEEEAQLHRLVNVGVVADARVARILEQILDRVRVPHHRPERDHLLYAL